MTDDMDAKHAKAAQLARVARSLRELIEDLDDIDAAAGDWRSANVARFEQLQLRVMAQLRLAEDLTGVRPGAEASARLHDAQTCAEYAWRVPALLQSTASELDRRALNLLR